MPAYQGRCHCGAIRFSFVGPEITRGLRCNCSLCRRKGAAMTTFMVAADQLQMQISGEALATYTFGSHVAQHHFCKHCGIYPFHETLRQPGFYRINIGCLEGVDATVLPCEVFDGAAL